MVMPPAPDRYGKDDSEDGYTLPRKMDRRFFFSFSASPGVSSLGLELDYLYFVR